MQFFRCQTCFPWITAGVIASALVSAGNFRWLSIVSAVKIAAKSVVPTAKKIRVWRLVMRHLGESDANAREVVDCDPTGIERRRDDDGDDDDAQEGSETS